MSPTGAELPALVSESWSRLRLRNPYGEQLLSAILALVLLIVAYAFHLHKLAKDVPNIPWAGGAKGPFARIRASFGEYRSGWTTLKEAHEKYGQHGIPFNLPQSNFGSTVIIPQDYLGWMMKQPETVLSSTALTRELFGFQHFLPWSTTDTCIRLSGGLINTMRVVLKSSETLLQRSLVEQVKQCVDQRLTLDEVKWTDVNVFDFISKVTYQVTAQVWIGEALFRNKAFVDAFEKYSFWFNCSSALLSSWTPPLLTSVIGLLLRIPTSMAQIRCEKLLLPVVQARWNEIKQMKSRSGYQIKEVPNDFLTSTIKTIMGPKYDEINSPEFISKIVVISGAGALPTSGVTGSNVIYDLLSSDPKYLERIREEVEQVFAEASHRADSSILSKLAHMDSAIRESLRFNPLLAIEPRRKIVHPNGTTLPNGTHLPQNTWIGISHFAIHFDETVYPNAKEFLPFRFLAASQERGLEGVVDGGKKVEFADTVLTSTGSNFVGFGAGRHTCPGRWLAAVQLKVILAYFVLHYEMKPLAQRPESSRIGAFNVPSRATNMQIRRRSVQTGSKLGEIQKKFGGWMASNEDA